MKLTPRKIIGYAREVVAYTPKIRLYVWFLLLLLVVTPTLVALSYHIGYPFRIIGFCLMLVLAIGVVLDLFRDFPDTFKETFNRNKED